MPFNIRRFLTVRGRHENSFSPFLSALSAEEDFFLLLFFSFVTCDSAAQVALEQMVMGMDPPTPCSSHPDQQRLRPNFFFVQILKELPVTDVFGLCLSIKGSLIRFSFSSPVTHRDHMMALSTFS